MSAPVRLIIEAQRLFRPRKHGMDVVALELLRRLKQMPTSFKKEVVVKADEDRCLEASEHLGLTVLPAAFYPLWEQRKLPAYTESIPGSVLHCTGNTAPLFSKTPLIVTIHDLIFLEENYLFKKNGGSLYQRFGNVYRSLIVPRVARRAKHIITVSHFQRNLIMKRLNVPPEKISVVYNGADERFFKQYSSEELQAALKQYGIDTTPYIFFLANTEPRKNTDGVLKAFKHFCETYPSQSLNLVIKGLTEEQLQQKLQQTGTAGISHRIRRVGYIEYDDLPKLYQAAALLWFPSFTEGFGLPIVEAMAGGVPVLTSSCSVMPEIGGDAAVYIDPNQPETWVTPTYQLLTDMQFRNTSSAKGRIQAGRFTWDQSLKQLMDVYQQVLVS